MPDLKLVGFDATLTNCGIAYGRFDVATRDLSIVRVELVTTEKTTLKGVRANSDDLARAIRVSEAVYRAEAASDIAFAEIPSGSQGARAALSFGVAIGVLAGIRIPLVQVMPSETKMHSVGRKTASKPQMIAWAQGLWPDLDWIRLHGRPDGALVKANEHMADACAVIVAGIATAEFQRSLSFSRLGSSV